jgi:signal transduction histidine kinase/ActR/RegA family two-component response regulator
MFRDLSLSLRQFLVLLAGLGLLPIAMIGAWAIHASVDQQRSELEQSMLGLSRALASAVDSELQTTLDNVKTLAASPQLAKGDIAAFYGVARAAALAQKDWLGVILTDESGRVLIRTTQPYGAATPGVVDPSSLQQAMQTRQPVIGTVAKGARKLAAVPVRVPLVIDGRLRYVVTAALAPDRVLGILGNQKVAPQWVVSVQDGHGLRVARSKDHDRTVATSMSPSLRALLEPGLAEGTGITTTLEGEQVITSYARLPRHGWTVIVGAPTARFSEVLRRTLAAYSVAIAGSLALYLALTVFLSERIVLSIAELKAQTARLGQKRPVREVRSRIREVNQIGQSLLTASAELMQTEREREALVISLRGALASLKDALLRAEGAAATKDNFLAVLGHELRNPLAPIVMALDLMDMRAGLQCQRERQTMRRQVNHMRRLVDDLLDVSRITQGKLTIGREPVCLSAAVNQAIDAVRPLMTAAGRRFVEDVDQVWVMGDETRLVQVATNLLANALRYGGDGDVRVSVKRVEGDCVLLVGDTGVGMEPATAARIFEPFYQAPQPLARSSGGLGLGLTIVASIVERLGGAIRATSMGAGKGSSFEVRLPAIDGPAAVPPGLGLRLGLEADPPGAARRVPRRVLIVDDNIDAARTTAELLGVLGHSVELAHDGKSALVLLQRMGADFADVLILDIGLPDMDGFQLAEAVRRLGFAGKLVALTGYGQESDKRRAFAAGFDLHLTKPVGLDQLENALASTRAPQGAAASSA